MRTRLTLRPGQNNTKKLLAQYGDRLVCVRYHYDDKSKRRVKTVGLIVDEIPWLAERPLPHGPDEKVWVRIGYGEKDLRYQVKLHGGAWDREKRLWQLTWSSAEALAVQARVVDC
jgi:hypothetical protein